MTFTLPTRPAEPLVKKTDGRPEWDDYFMAFAEVASRRGTCLRLKVGAVIIVDKQVVATGYNGASAGMAHCLDDGCDMEAGHCVRTVHAEMNALCQAAQRGVSVKGATIYTTASPCWECFRVLVNAGIHTFVFAMEYRPGASSERIRNACKQDWRLVVRQHAMSAPLAAPIPSGSIAGVT
jgi:dCMP deaminase